MQSIPCRVYASVYIFILSHSSLGVADRHNLSHTIGAFFNHLPNECTKEGEFQENLKCEKFLNIFEYSKIYIYFFFDVILS